MEKKETERGKKESGDENQSTKKYIKSEGMCVCAKMNVYVTPLSTPLPWPFLLQG